MSERGDRNPPEIGESGGESDGGDGEEIGLAVASTGEERATPNPRHPQAEGLIP